MSWLENMMIGTKLIATNVLIALVSLLINILFLGGVDHLKVNTNMVGLLIVVEVLAAVGLGVLLSNSIRKPLNKLVDVAAKLAKGDLEVDLGTDFKKNELGDLMSSFAIILDSMKQHTDEIGKIALGDLAADIVVKSEKDILAKGLRQVVNKLKKLLSEMDYMSKQHDAGDIDVFLPEENFDGEFQTMAKGINEMVKGHISVKKKAMACVAQFANGNFDADLEQFPGKKAFINDNLEGLRSNLKSVNKEIKELISASNEGKLSERANSKNFHGDWSALMEGLNGLIDAIIEPVQEAANVLDELANGNLSVSVKGNYKGDHAKIKNALNETINTFNEVLGDINNASSQVAAGARQISDSAQALSQGTTEQASSVEQLSASMEEIANQTKLNAKNAEQANLLALESKNGASEGNEQMRNMLQAMGAINESSSNISKIIKVIDEIAFQTNILALNAAVEAARAGQHGKGFAVVAEEVRNLAARSANAAKETTVLIEGSIKKVEDGTRIANLTADALNRIVEGITQASALVGEIAVASSEQAAGIAQVNQGIIQVSDVVQSNSATSEESAAASEELSRQAELLREQVSRFKLKKTLSGKELDELHPDVVHMLEEMSVRKNHAGGYHKRWAETAVDGNNAKIILTDNQFGKY
jgi:methyl-accepting chemotaxis protein